MTSSSSEKKKPPTKQPQNTSFLKTEVKFLTVDKSRPVLVSGVLLAIATALGAWGGFPEPPNWFSKFVNTKMSQYALVFVLIYQGGSSQNWKLAFAITSILYIISHMDN